MMKPLTDMNGVKCVTDVPQLECARISPAQFIDILNHEVSTNGTQTSNIETDCAKSIKSFT